MLVVDDLWAGYSSPVLRGVSFVAKPGELVAVVGPNGSGKTTLLRCLAGILKPRKGRIVVYGRDMWRMEKQQLAKLVGYVPQSVKVPEFMTVLEYVLLGRMSYKRSWRVHSEDLEAAYEALDMLGIDNLATRYLNELSGGQLQLVTIAQALAKNPKLLLLDEPTSSLDLRRQYEVMDLIATLTRKRGMITIAVHHDLNLALEYSDKVLVLSSGSIRAFGSPLEVLKPEIITEVYGVSVRVVSVDGSWRVIPLKPVGGGQLEANARMDAKRTIEAR